MKERKSVATALYRKYRGTFADRFSLRSSVFRNRRFNSSEFPITPLRQPLTGMRSEGRVGILFIFHEQIWLVIRMVYIYIYLFIWVGYWDYVDRVARDTAAVENGVRRIRSTRGPTTTKGSPRAQTSGLKTWSKPLLGARAPSWTRFKPRAGFG